MESIPQREQTSKKLRSLHFSHFHTEYFNKKMSRFFFMHETFSQEKDY